MKIKIAKYLYNNKKINNGIEKQKKTTNSPVQPAKIIMSVYVFG